MLIPALVAVSATLGTCALPDGDITLPQTWGDYFVDKYAADRAASMELDDAIVPPPIAHERTVLLITGVTIPAESFDPIAARLRRDGFRPVVYEPPALLSGDLFENSRLLGEEIERIIAMTGETKIDILAECTGGLIARHYMQALGGDAHVSRMVTFISPQHGLPKAPLAKSFVGWEALDDLTPGSEFLETVNNAPLPAGIPITSVYTCTDEYIQPYETSIIPGATNVGLGCDGTFVGHFQFFYDDAIYRVMHAGLVVPADDSDDPVAPTDPTMPDPTDPSDPDEDEVDGGGCSSGGGGTSAVLGLGLAASLRRRRR